MNWLTTEPPKDGTAFLADVGWPWAVVAAWNKPSGAFVYSILQAGLYNGEYTDFYFENEYEKTVKRWMPLPELTSGY